MEAWIPGEYTDIRKKIKNGPVVVVQGWYVDDEAAVVVDESEVVVGEAAVVVDEAPENKTN